ncbi:uncharacterized protein LDX57_011301 [Aspergillus melleus]|uniref:uncharacterized protein n=1 Tax=Aspergillus melleus TaxID=138277 RepID=UPI001E8E5369|nr:uncharacterized protein LDX57_011301 [Aspergillus melleus]KAH8433667.1 hypothetical protein LDX57_011301 [Aspergillus melleus]
MKIRNLLAASAALLSWASNVTARFAETPLRLVNSTSNPASHDSHSSPHFNITADVEGSRNSLAFVLETNREFTAQDAYVQYIDVHGNVRSVEPSTQSTYHVTKGSVWMRSAGRPWVKVGWARITVLEDTTKPLFEGTFAISSEQYRIQLEQDRSDGLSDLQTGYMLVYPASAPSISGQDDSSLQQTCASPSMAILDRRQLGWDGDSAEENLADTVGSTSGCPTSRRIAYIGVVTDCTYSGEFNSTDAVRRNIINVVNTASVVFENSFNVSLGLRNITISDADCPDSASRSSPWNAPCSSGNLNWRLDRFSSWRSSIDDDNAYWSLLTGCPNTGAVGISWVGELCNTGASGSRSSTPGANVIARSQSEWQVFAHESAHTFGAVHDCDSSTCQAGADNDSQCCPRSSSTCDADGEYIMNPSSNRGMTRFSPCTIGNVCSRFGSRRTNTQCLVSASDADNGGNSTGVPNGQCGNGIVEAGEACDCGGNACNERDARCCDSMTCQWRGGEECARSRAGGGSGSEDDSARSWVDAHRPLVIGLSAGIGGALVLAVILAIIACCWRRRKPRKLSESS